MMHMFLQINDCTELITSNNYILLFWMITNNGITVNDDQINFHLLKTLIISLSCKSATHQITPSNNMKCMKDITYDRKRHGNK